MRQRTVLIGFILFSASFAVGQSGCDSGEALNCTFHDTWCSWDVDTTKWSYDTVSGVKCAAFTGSGIGTMKSGTACSTGGHTHCLRTRYLFKQSNGIDIIVFVKSNGVDKEQVWNGTGRRVDAWYAADIPISSDREFRVTLEAKKKQGSGRIFIDYMTYVASPCQPAQTTTVSSSGRTVSSTEVLTTTTSLHTSNDSPIDTTVVTPEERKTTSSSNISTAASKDETMEGSSDAGVAVGVVFAVVIVAVLVAVFILYRRNQLHLLKTCFRNGNSKKTAEAVKYNRDDKRPRNTGKETVSGYVNHAVTVSDPQSSHTYYNTIKDIENPEDSAAYQNSTTEQSQSSKSKTLPQTTQPADQDHYEIKAEDGTVPLKFSATRYVNPNVKMQGKTGQYQNFPKPAANRGNTQSPSDYSMAQVVGDEATGVYHCLEEEDSYSKGEGGDTAVYHYAKDPGVNEAGNADGAGVYHILEEESSAHQPTGAYHTPSGSNVKATKEETGNYNTLDFAAKSCGQKETEAASGGMYNHLNDGSDDPYNEVHREKRAAVIDAEYSHIK